MNCMKYYKFTQYVWLKMRDFEVKNAKIFWGGLSPPQTPPNNEEGDTPSSNSSPQCREASNFFFPKPIIMCTITNGSKFDFSNCFRVGDSARPSTDLSLGFFLGSAFGSGIRRCPQFTGDSKAIISALDPLFVLNFWLWSLVWPWWSNHQIVTSRIR